MVYTVSPDVLMTCPLDESHRILKSRMQFHLVRCLKNHKLDLKIKCPWNPLHIIEKIRYEEHFTNCEDMPLAIQFLAPAEGCSNVASVPMSAYKSAVPPCEENWDALPPVSTYDPLKQTADKPILKVSVGGSKARKKQFRLEERRRHQALEETAPIQTMVKTLRPPHQLTLAVSADMKKPDKSKLTKDAQKTPVTKKVGGLRMPHELSPATLDLTKKKNGTINDESLERKEVQNIAAADAKKVNAKTKPKDSKSRKTSESDVTVNKNVEDIRKVLQQVSEIAKENAAAAKKKMKNELSEMEKSVDAQNENGLTETIGNVEEPNEEIEKLSQRLASLANIEKTILEQKNAILAQMNNLALPKLINPKSADTSIDKCPDLVNGASDDDDDSTPPPLTNPDSLPIAESLKNNGGTSIKEPVERRNGCSFALPRCAANFTKTASSMKSPVPRAERGIDLEYEAIRNTRPNGRQSNPVPQPKINRKYDAGNNHSPLNFSLEVGSVYGYEEADD